MLQQLTPADIISVWTGEKKYININGKRFSSWQEKGQLCFLWGKNRVEIALSIFREGDCKYLTELCRIIGLIYWGPRP